MRSAAPRSLLALILISLLAGACGGSPSPATAAEERRQVLQQRFPDIVGASFDPIGDTTWSVRVTLSSPYDSEDRYADAWRVLLPDGTVLGTRQLTHDHAAEQPFTRALNNVEIPEATSILDYVARYLDLYDRKQRGEAPREIRRLAVPAR